MPITAQASGFAEPLDEDGEDILVVDDDPANLLAIEVALGDLGRKLVKADSGAAALRCLLTGRFALVLLDVKMPDMNGFETARLIRGRPSTKHLPIIFITAYRRDNAEMLEGYALGAVDFLFKPIVPEILRAKASVFVQMRRHTIEVARQAAMLRAHEKLEHDRRLDNERQRWEAESLRRTMEQERRAAAELTRRAEELARTVAELERAEAELTRSNEQLEEADRRKDEFLAMLAHELRNPLAPIVNSLALFREGHVENGSLARAREAMERQVMHLVRLVEDLLDVSRITSGRFELRFEILRIADIVEQAVAMSLPHIEARQHRLRIESADAAIAVRGDAVRLTQVLANLLNNAARYTCPPGEIVLTTRHETDEVVISVCDTGRGIAAERLESIFEMFVRDANEGGGLGLGLTLVDRIVKLHGGRVSALSEGEGRGSRFDVHLPSTAIEQVLNDSPASGDRDGAKSPESASALDIVVIEDNADIRETVQLLLECWGHRVQAAPDGREGIELLLSTRPDVALIDIGLPIFDGYTVAARVRESLGASTPRMIAMTGFGQNGDRKKALESGFDEHLVKPVEPDQLRAVLADAKTPPAKKHHDRTSLVRQI